MNERDADAAGARPPKRLFHVDEINTANLDYWLSIPFRISRPRKKQDQLKINCPFLPISRKNGRTRCPKSLDYAYISISMQRPLSE